MSDPARTLAMDGTRDLGVARLDPYLDATRPRHTARAPARLDVMGGITDFTGGLSLALTLGCGAWATVQRRRDRRLLLLAPPASAGGPWRECALPFSDVFDPAGRWLPLQRIDDRLASAGAPWARPVLAVLQAMSPPGPVTDWGEGLTIAWDQDAAPEQGIAAPAALQVACCEAIGAELHVALEPPQVADICRRADRSLGSLSAGPLDAIACLLGGPEALLCAAGHGAHAPSTIRLPGCVCILGIDAGTQHPQAEQKYRETRAAALMGAAIIDFINRRDVPGAPSIDGNLARISQGHFVSRYRDRIPTRIRGREFLDRYGPLADPVVDVDPAAVYKVRARTEHHVYDHERTQQFLGLMRRAGTISNARWLEDAGRLMNCSHWSYGQRCGLSTIELDVLVNLLQRQGIARGIYGARVSGRGAGGTVTVLTHNSPAAHETVERALGEYHAQTGRRAQRLEPGWCGARQYGVRQD